MHHWPRICKRWGKVRINPVLIQGQIKDDGKATIKLALNFWMFIKSLGVLEWTANSFIRFTQTLISQIFICEDIQPAFSSFWTSEISRGFHKNNVLLTSPLAAKNKPNVWVQAYTELSKVYIRFIEKSRVEVTSCMSNYVRQLSHIISKY